MRRIHVQHGEKIETECEQQSIYGGKKRMENMYRKQEAMISLSLF